MGKQTNTRLEQDSQWQWHQLGHMQMCSSPQADNYASTPPVSFYARQHICYSTYMPWQFRLSICLSHRSHG